EYPNTTKGENLFNHHRKSHCMKGIAIPEERLFASIFNIRGHKVMLDADLAELYGVETRVLKQAVRRNRNRFPTDFMFELSEGERAEQKEFLRSQPTKKVRELKS